MRIPRTAALLLLLAACGRPGSPSAGLRLVSALGGYTVTLETAPSPIPLNQPFEATLRIAPRTPPAAALAVEVDARMPEHFHGMNRVARTTLQPDGSFKVDGLLFHMPGRWELYVDITEGPRTERAQLEVVLK
jgi:hypothetical protein